VVTVFQTQYENTTANYSISDYSKSYIKQLKLKVFPKYRVLTYTALLLSQFIYMIYL